VVTSTPPEQEWAETKVVEDGLADFVIDLKQQPGDDIGIHGSISLTQSLLEASLVDKLRLVIAPAPHAWAKALRCREPSRALADPQPDLSRRLSALSGVPETLLGNLGRRAVAAMPRTAP
jgi:hypothetical protein